jgi:hypothetical protein
MNEYETAVSFHRSKKSPVTLARLQYDHRQPLVWHFALLLRTIIENSEFYRLWAEQCYWMCSTIMTSLHHAFPEGKLHSYPQRSLEGTYGGVPIPRSQERQNGIREQFMQELSRFECESHFSSD